MTFPVISCRATQEQRGFYSCLAETMALAHPVNKASLWKPPDVKDVILFLNSLTEAILAHTVGWQRGRTLCSGRRALCFWDAMSRAVQPGGIAACSVTVISPVGSPAECYGPQVTSQRAIKETAKH